MPNRPYDYPRTTRPLRPALKVPAARRFKIGRIEVAVPARRSDLQRGLIVLASLAALIVGLAAGGYGVHSHLVAAQERTARYYWQVAATTRSELSEGPVLFVPIGGNMCRRRWIDNATWTLRDGGEVECDNEIAWNSTLPIQQYNVGMRMDAVRNTFRARSSGNLE